MTESIGRKKRKKAALFSAFFILIACCFLKTEAGATEQEPVATGPDWAIDEATAPAVVAESAVLMDVDTGVILYEKNAHRKQFPASITKILTCLLARENTELTDMVTFSHQAVFGIERGSSNIGIDEGEQLTMEQCLYATLLESANEVAAGIAEHVGGSPEGFSAMMNEKAKELGCTESNFVNANGLPDDNHYTSAYDMALISRAFFQDETLTKISGTVLYHIPATATQKDEIDLRNHHRMLEGCQFGSKYCYDYTIGGKTGYTDTARHTLVTCGEKNGHRLVCVVLKDEKWKNYIDSTALLEYGFACYEKEEVSGLLEERAQAIAAQEAKAAEEAEAAKQAAQEQKEAQDTGPLLNTLEKEGGEEGEYEETAAQAKNKEKKESRFSVLQIVVIVLVTAAAAVCGFLFFSAYRRELERKRRRAEIMARHRARRSEEDTDE